MTTIGRRKLVTNVTVEQLQDREYLEAMFNSAMETHILNKVEIDYLMNYHRGLQPILAKEKTVREEINNITVVNHAYAITRTVVGYFLGTPIQYIQSKTNMKDEIEMLNDLVSYEDKPSVDIEIGENQSICGLGYRIIVSDSSDEVPFEDRSLDPATTFVVHSNDINDKPVAGITYFQLYNKSGNPDGIMAYIYTEKGVFTVETKGEAKISDTSIVNYTEYNIGAVPIIEYPNNARRMGDWEFVLSIMDDINALQSGRMDDIEQIVQSLIVFTNAEIDADTYSSMREAGVVMLQNKSQNKSSVDVINNPLDQNGMNTYAEELQRLLYTLVGIPSRDSRSGGGGDTGDAVELRDGWADLEIVARGKEGVFKRSEKQALKVILSILNNKVDSKLSLKDVDIKFSRNKNHNLLVKTQAYQTLLATESLAPADVLTIVDLVSDVNEYVSRGEAYWGGELEREDTSNETETEVVTNNIEDAV